MPNASEWGREKTLATKAFWMRDSVRQIAGLPLLGCSMIPNKKYGSVCRHHLQPTKETGHNIDSTMVHRAIRLFSPGKLKRKK